MPNRKTRLTILLSMLFLTAAAGLIAQPMIEPEEREPAKERMLTEFDVSSPAVDLDHLVVGIPEKDAIPALTAPERIPAADLRQFGSDARVLAVEVNAEAVAYPINILNYHEVVNDVVGDQPVVIVYCPLCDSASAAYRTIETDDGPRSLEFGVSGFLLYSNVVMYERSSDALWSQVAMEALTGPHAGRSLKHLPARVVSLAEFREAYPNGEALSPRTGYNMPYQRSPYDQYFNSNAVFYDFDHPDDLPAKTLGMGILAGDRVWFVPQLGAMDEAVTLDTPAGRVVITATRAGMQVAEAPEDVRTVQTFWHSWSAFHPMTRITPSPEAIGFGDWKSTGGR